MEIVLEKLKSFREGWEACEKYIYEKPYRNNDYILSIDHVISRYYGCDFRAMKIKYKGAEIVLARQLAMYFLYRFTTLTLKEIAKMFVKDHTTVIHSRDKIKNYLSVHDPIEREIFHVENLIKEHKANGFVNIPERPKIPKRVYRYERKASKTIEVEIEKTNRPPAIYSNIGYAQLIDKYTQP